MMRVIIGAGLFLCWAPFVAASEGMAASKAGSFSLEADEVRSTVQVAYPSVVIVTGFVVGEKLDPDTRGRQVGVGVDLYVGEQRCAMARDIRSGIKPQYFDDTFGATATCIVRLDVGPHILVARRVSADVTNARVTLSWSVRTEQ